MRAHEIRAALLIHVGLVHRGRDEGFRIDGFAAIRAGDGLDINNVTREEKPKVCLQGEDGRLGQTSQLLRMVKVRNRYGSYLSQIRKVRLSERSTGWEQEFVRLYPLR